MVIRAYDKSYLSGAQNILGHAGSIAIEWVNMGINSSVGVEIGKNNFREV